MKSIYILCICILFFSCYNEHESTETYTRAISFDSCKYVYPDEDTLLLDDANCGTLMSRDSFLIMTCYEHPTHFMFVYRKDNYALVASLFPKGHATTEFQNAPNFATQITENGDEWGFWNYNIALGMYQHINMSKSIETGKTEIDSTISYNYIKQFSYPFGKTFFCGDSILGRMQETYEYGEIIPARYYICNNSNNCDIMDTLNIYERSTKEKKISHSLSSCDVFNEKRKIIAMAMSWMPIVNLVDIDVPRVLSIKTSSIKGITPESNRRKLRNYYLDAAYSEDNIYLLYADGKEGIGETSNTIQVIDWNGNPIEVIKTHSGLIEIYYDSTDRTLYGRDSLDNYFSYKLWEK